MSIRNAIHRCLSKVTAPLSDWRRAGGEALFILLLLASCQQQEDILPNPEPEKETKGHIMLTLGGDDIFIEAECSSVKSTTYPSTRAATALTDISGYVFTITGTTEFGETITNQPVTLERVGTTNTFIGTVEAGTYILTADNFADAAYGTTGKPYYSGSSEDFTIEEATTVNVSINLGKPKNAAVTYMLDGSFSTLYENPTIYINDNDGNLPTLTTPAATTTDLANAVYCHVATAPATQSLYTSTTSLTLNYTLYASAREGSHVTDINAATGTITVTSGRHTIITLTANTLTGEIIPIASGTHTSEFD